MSRNYRDGETPNDRQRYRLVAAGLIGLIFLAVASGQTSWVEGFGVALALTVIAMFG
jgi:hypothetical protein